VRKVQPANPFSLIRPIAAADSGMPGTHTWGLDATAVPDLWAQGLTGVGVKVAHLDTGVDAGHPALANAVTEFAEFDLTGRIIADAKVSDSDQRDGHGTHTAATIAGRAVDGHHVGVAPGAELCAAMVIEGGDAVARILGGMDWAVGLGVRVLSMSLGIRGLVADFLDIVQVLRDSGVLPVIAVGNEGPGTSRSPGNYPNALSVGACDAAGEVADFSSSQRFKRRTQPLTPDLVAPGVDVISAKPGGCWRTLSGSSMATPHVAGLAALLMQARPQASIAQVERAIFRSAQRGAMDRERVNRGAVHAGRALTALTG
jgi:subtilisin